MRYECFLMLLSIPRAMTVVASAGEGDGQDARGERLVRGVDYVPDSFDASEDEDNGVEVESARGEARIRGVNYVPDSIDASEDDDNGVEVDSIAANDDMMKLDLGESVVPCSPLFSSRARKVAPSCFICSKITEGN
jgi:hypothetical protein